MNFCVELYSIWFYLDGPTTSTRECYLLFHSFPKKGVVLRKACIAIYYSVDQMRRRLVGRWRGEMEASGESLSLRSSPMVAFVDARNTNSETGQSQRKLTCLILSLSGRQRSSFHLSPRARIFGPHLTNKTVSRPNCRGRALVPSAEGRRYSGWKRPGKARRSEGVTRDRQASGAAK